LADDHKFLIEEFGNILLLLVLLYCWSYLG